VSAYVYDLPQESLSGGFDTLQGCEVEVEILCPLSCLPFKFFDRGESLPLVPCSKINLGILF
jgi:hypothetical protein